MLTLNKFISFCLRTNCVGQANAGYFVRYAMCSNLGMSFRSLSGAVETHFFNQSKSFKEKVIPGVQLQ